jgi:hypothetical protein
MSFSRSHDGTEAYRRAAHYVEKILRSAKVSDPPYELPTKFDLVIMLRSPKRMASLSPRMLTVIALIAIASPADASAWNYGCKFAVCAENLGRLNW